MPVSKRIFFSILVIVSGAFGFYLEQQSGSDGLAKAMIILTVMLLISLWSLVPVNRDASNNDADNRGRHL